MKILRKQIISTTLKEGIKGNPTMVKGNKASGGQTRKGKATNNGEMIKVTRIKEIGTTTTTLQTGAPTRMFPQKVIMQIKGRQVSQS